MADCPNLSPISCKNIHGAINDRRRAGPDEEEQRLPGQSLGRVPGEKSRSFVERDGGVGDTKSQVDALPSERGRSGGGL